MMGSNQPKSLAMLLAERGISLPQREPTGLGAGVLGMPDASGRIPGDFASNTPSLSPVEIPNVSPKPSFFGGGGAGWKILGSLGDALTAAGGGHGNYIPSLIEKQRLAQEQKRLDAQDARADARNNRPQIVPGKNGGFIVVNPMTGEVINSAPGTPEPTTLQQNVEYLAGLPAGDPRRAYAERALPGAAYDLDLQTPLIQARAAAQAQLQDHRLGNSLSLKSAPTYGQMHPKAGAGGDGYEYQMINGQLMRRRAR